MSLSYGRYRLKEDATTVSLKGVCPTCGYTVRYDAFTPEQVFHVDGTAGPEFCPKCLAKALAEICPPMRDVEVAK